MPIKKPARKPFGVKSEPKPSKTQIRNKTNKKHAKKMNQSDKEYSQKITDQIVDNMGKDYDKSLTKQMRKSDNQRQYIGNEEVGEYNEAKVHDRMETDAMNSVAKKYGISKMKKGGRVGLKSGGLAKRGKGCEIK
jgi:hypothetical protein